MKSNIWRTPLLVVALVLSCTNGWAQDDEDGADEGAAAVVPASTMKIKLRGDDMDISGTPIDLETITVNTLFGEAKLPMHTVAGVRFAQNEGEQTTIVLQNGDVLTGELGLENVKLISGWGEATVNVPYIETIVFRSDLSWTPVTTASGTRWRLTKIQNRPTNGERFYRVEEE